MIATTTRAEIDFPSSGTRVGGPPEVLSCLGAIFPTGPSWSPVRSCPPRLQLAVENDRSGYQALCQGTTVAASERLDQFLDQLVNIITGAMVQELLPRFVLFHAGSVSWDGLGILLPANSGSGKTTLVAGLMAAGFRFYGDEVAVVHPDTLCLYPFNRSLYLKSGSRDALSALYPELDGPAPIRRASGQEIWPLQPPEEAWPTAPAPVRFVIIPQYGSGSPTRLEPWDRSAALSALVEQWGRPRTPETWPMDAVFAMLRGAACYRLFAGDLDEAVRIVMDLVQS